MNTIKSGYSYKVNLTFAAVLYFLYFLYLSPEITRNGRKKIEKGAHPGTDPGLKVIKSEYILRLKIKRNDWLLAESCLQASNHYALF